MKEAEDDCEIVIKSMFFHIMAGKRCKLRATSTSRCLEAARTTRRCARSAHHGTFSADGGDKHGRSGDLSSRSECVQTSGTQILEGIMTFLLERKTERIEDQTVDLPVQQIETENLR